MKNKTRRRVKKGVGIAFQQLPKRNNDSLPLIWVDVMVFGRRQDQEMATLRFYALLQEAAVEQVRLQTSTAHLKRMVEVLANALNHYPTRPSVSRTSSKH